MKLASHEVAFMFIYKECMCMKNKVKELRTKSKITQQQLADMVHVSSRTIISIEKEQYNPYNKNSFIEGFIMTLLGLLLFITILVTEFNIKKFLLSPLLLFMGIGLIERSISKSMSKEDKVDKNDERNQFISLKSRGKALQITQMCSWIIMLLILIIGKINNHMMLISLGTGMMIIFTISLFTELFCNIYYERIF